MRHAIASIVFILAGCGGSLSSQVGHVSQAAAVVDVQGEAAIKLIVAAQDIRHAQCSELQDEAYTECMGLLGEELTPAFRQFGTAFDELAEAIVDLEAAAVHIDRLLEQAQRTKEGR